MKKLMALLLALTMMFALVACGETAPAATPTPAPAESEAPESEAPQSSEVPGESEDPAATPDPIPDEGGEVAYKIGCIFVHDENSGYDIAHIDGIRAAMETLGIPEENVIFKYNIPEDETCYDTAVDLAEEGCTHIFSNSYGHQSHMQLAAEEYPEVIFCPATGDTAATSGLANLKNYFNYTFESRYVSGVVAGMKLAELLDSGAASEPLVGYVGAFPYAEVVSGYTAFFLGIRSIVPEATMQVTYTNSWYDPVAEAAAAESLISKGCVIIGQHADSTGAPSAVQAKLESGTVAYSVGYNVDMLAVAPTAALTSAQNNWGVYYTYAFDCILKGEEIVTDWASGYTDGAVMISALGESCAEGTAEKVAEVEAALKDGSLKVFDCSTFTVGGETLSSYTESYGMNGAECIVDGVFTESTIRSAPYFDLRIDGITELN